MEDFVTNKGKFITKDQKHLLIDGDLLCFAAASAADGRKYKALDGKFRPIFDTADEVNNYLKEIGLTSLWRETIYIPEPVENCLHSLKLMLEAIFEDTCSNKHTIFITGNGNFRYEVSPSYKANRLNARKPFHLKSCHQYLLDNYNTRIVHGAEADDMMGIAQSQSAPDSTMICTLDKDLDMIPGWHYKWATQNRSSETYKTSFTEGMRCFFKQLITGDATDNIEGLSEKAPKRRTYSTKPVDSMDSVEEMIVYVGKGYLQKYGDLQTAREKCREASKLLWILRKASSYKVLNHNIYLQP